MQEIKARLNGFTVNYIPLDARQMMNIQPASAASDPAKER